MFTYLASYMYHSLHCHRFQGSDGIPGQMGDQGDPGEGGKRGPRGSPGKPGLAVSELIQLPIILDTV